MEKNIQSILEELYAVDPTLKNHEIEIAQIVTDMMKYRPHTQFDEEFSHELKNRIREKFSSHESLDVETKHVSFFKSRFVYVLGGAVATLAIALPVIYASSTMPSKIMKNSFTAGTRVVKAEANAFGPLLAVSTQNSYESAVAPRATSAGTGSGGVAMDAVVDKRVSSLIYNPVYTNYHFSFSGELPELLPSIEVLRRENGMDAAQQYAGVFQKLNLGIFDLGSFRQPYVQSFSLAEDRSFGYQINVDALNGTVSIMQNYQKWTPSRSISCNGDTCNDPNQISYDQIPEDSKLVAAADAFLKEYGINMSSYGPGAVDSRWKIGYLAAEDRSAFYIPNVQTIMYQLQINDKPAYEEYGEPVGVRVTVNVIDMKVIGVDGIMTKTFSASSYGGETSSDRIKALVEKGRTAVYADATKTVEAEIDGVESGYMRKWQYNEKNGTSYELYVPALIFSIKNAEELQKEGLYQNKIIIPLASEMISELEQQNNNPIQIMPMSEPMIKSSVPMSEPAVRPKG